MWKLTAEIYSSHRNFRPENAKPQGDGEQRCSEWHSGEPPGNGTGENLVVTALKSDGIVDLETHQ